MDERAGGGQGPSPDWLDDWQTGRRLNTRGRNKIVLAAGMLSRTGEALNRFGGFLNYLMSNHGYEAGDFLEISYNTVADVEGFRPIPYDTEHCELSLTDVISHVGRGLRWYRSILPDDTRYHLIGYSLGGVALFESAAALLFGEPERWQGRIGSLTTLSAPLFGTDLGLVVDVRDHDGLCAAIKRPVDVAVLVLEQPQDRGHAPEVAGPRQVGDVAEIDGAVLAFEPDAIGTDGSELVDLVGVGRTGQDGADFALG
jgi:hypothetical protein